jgi:hypothetical protein
VRRSHAPTRRRTHRRPRGAPAYRTAAHREGGGRREARSRRPARPRARRTRSPAPRPRRRRRARRRRLDPRGRKTPSRRPGTRGRRSGGAKGRPADSPAALSRRVRVPNASRPAGPPGLKPPPVVKQRWPSTGKGSRRGPRERSLADSTAPCGPRSQHASAPSGHASRRRCRSGSRAHGHVLSDVHARIAEQVVDADELGNEARVGVGCLFKDRILEG